MWILLGNLLSLFGSLCSLLSTRAKTYKNTLLIQSLDATFFTLSCVCLGGYSGIVVNFVAILRNLCCALFPIKIWVKIAFVGITIGFGVLFMDKSIYGILPIVASSYYTIAMLYTKDIVKLKKALIVNNIFWLLYNFAIWDFVGVFFKIISIVSCFQSMKYNNLLLKNK